MMQLHLANPDLATIETKVAGVTFEGRQYKLGCARRAAYRGAGLKWAVVRDPDNAFDPCAVKVLVGYADEDGAQRWAHVGFVPADVARELAPVMDRTGKRPKVQGRIHGSSRRGRNLGCSLSIVVELS